MRVVRWHPGIGHVTEHSGMVAKLKLLRETGRPELSRLFADPDVPIDEFLKFVVSHYRLAFYVSSRATARACPEVQAEGTSGIRSAGTDQRGAILHRADHSARRSLARKALKDGQRSSWR